MAMKWTGDNAATWHDLQWTISSVLLTGLVGIPDVGEPLSALSDGLLACPAWAVNVSAYDTTKSNKHVCISASLLREVS